MFTASPSARVDVVALFGSSKRKKEAPETPGPAGQADRGILVFENTGEVIQELGLKDITLTVTSVDLVRGALATAHGTLKAGVQLKDLWKAYRAVAEENPFVRIVKEKRGIYRVPEPKILAGSNYADLGFDFDPETGHVIAMGAIDNLMKGASGSAVQCMNLMLGFEETLGLEFYGLHPI